MQYRRFGQLEWKVSALGFGCMRLPTIGGDHSKIDEPLAARMLHYAIDHGVNYLDTAYPYHGGASEAFVGRALKDGYRERVKVATKMPSWLIEGPADFDRYLAEQLGRLQLERVDFYLLHGLDAERWHKLRDLGVREWAGKALADGRIGHIGFSFHDSYQVLEEILGEYDRWTLCQIQYNYMDVENQAGTRGLKLLGSKGLAAVIMEPLLGGRLVNPPPAVEALWRSAVRQRTPADWALQWLWNQPEVSVVLSGMSTLQQVEENVASALRAPGERLTPDELELVGRVRAQYQALRPIPCTGCEYCLPCPNGVRIPRLLEMYNAGLMYNKLDEARQHYARMEANERADACQACRECEDKCPQSIPVSEWMERVHQVLGEGRPYGPEGPQSSQG